MKKIISIILVLSLSMLALVACGGGKDAETEKSYTLVVVVDSAVNATSNKVSNTALALVIDADNKIVAARFDSAEATPTLDENGALVAENSVATKVEQGDEYDGMDAGSWEKQTKAFEDHIKGMTADQVANLDASLVSGCTMASTPATFKALVAEAFNSGLKVQFKTSEPITLGIAISTAVKAGKSENVSVSSDFAGVVMAGGKVVAAMIDSCEQSFTIEEGAIVAGTLAASKNEQGDNYKMDAGSWASQAQVYANFAVGKTVAELNNLDTVSDALANAGCTMQNTTGGYKATIIKAAGYAR